MAHELLFVLEDFFYSTHRHRRRRSNSSLLQRHAALELRGFELMKQFMPSRSSLQLAIINQILL